MSCDPVLESIETWNYRVVTKVVNNETYYGIYEVHYDAEGVAKLVSDDSIGPYGESLGEMIRDLDHMRQALLEPVLRYEDIVKGDGDVF